MAAIGGSALRCDIRQRIEPSSVLPEEWKAPLHGRRSNCGKRWFKACIQRSH
jgi:hypothetical protein